MRIILRVMIFMLIIVHIAMLASIVFVVILSESLPTLSQLGILEFGIWFAIGVAIGIAELMRRIL